MQAGVPSLAQLDWVDGLEDTAVALSGEMEEHVQNLRHGAAVSAGRAGEEMLLSKLQSQAAWCDSRRDEAELLAAAAWRLQDRDPRAAAGAEEEQEVVRAAASEFREHVARGMNGRRVPETDAAARTEGAGARLVERFRRSAADYGGRVRRERRPCGGSGGAEALCADPDVLVARMLTSGSWRLSTAFNRHSSMPGSCIWIEQ